MKNPREKEIKINNNNNKSKNEKLEAALVMYVLSVFPFKYMEYICLFTYIYFVTVVVRLLEIRQSAFIEIFATSSA